MFLVTWEGSDQCFFWGDWRGGRVSLAWQATKTKSSVYLSLWQASSSLSPNNRIGSPLSLSLRITFESQTRLKAINCHLFKNTFSHYVSSRTSGIPEKNKNLFSWYHCWFSFTLILLPFECKKYIIIRSSFSSFLLRIITRWLIFANSEIRLFN